MQLGLDTTDGVGKLTGSKHLYIHVPFCARRCSYCDFSIAVRKETPVEEYLTALATELSQRLGGERNQVDTIYLGGGTPSRLGAAGIVRLLDLVRSYVSVEPGAEITMEANPDDINREAASAWRGAGINRLSIGAQSFDDDVLKWMHRTHSSAQIQRAVAVARDAGIENISIDLIFSLPQSLNRSWLTDLHEAEKLNPYHISLYGLTVEPKTPLARWEERGSVTQAPEESYETEYLLAHETLSLAGYEHYEVSNFGKPGLHSRHNSAYWSGAKYLGVGPSAHSFDGERRSWNVTAYADWVRKLSAGQSPIAETEVLTGTDKEIERLYLGLRTTKGASIHSEQMDQVQSWVNAGWGNLEGDWLSLTPLGWLRLDALVSDLTAFPANS